MTTFRGGLPRSELSRLTRCQPVLGVAIIAREWLLIACAALVAVKSGHWYVYLLSIAVIATRQHALATLMHEAAHGLMFRGRRTNEVVGDALLAFPLFISTRLYRVHHLQHHRNLNTPLDPDWDD